MPPLPGDGGIVKRNVLIDASSAILLFRSDWMDPLMTAYRVKTGPVVFDEITVQGYPGARTFQRWHRENRLVVDHQPSSALANGTIRPPLGPGESECIHLYHGGAGAFIIMDDGPGAHFCRREAIPYINALLIPRLLYPGPVVGGSPIETAIRKLYASGRYASWVLDYALNSPVEKLTFFLP